MEAVMNSKVLSVTEAVRNFSDYVSRVAYRRESFILRRGKTTLAELRPVPMGHRLGDLPRMLASLPTLTPLDAPRFASDVAGARTSLKTEPLRDPWAS